MSELSQIYRNNEHNPSRFISGFDDLEGDQSQFLAGSDVYLDANDVARCSPDYDVEQHLDQLDELLTSYRTLREIYHEKMRYYKGDHSAIHKLEQVKNMFNDSTKVMINVPKNIVNTFVGYTNGKPAKITYTPADGDIDSTAGDTVNNLLSDLFNRVHADSLFYEVSKDASIYGRGYLVAYKSTRFAGGDEELRFTVRSPENCLVVYSNDNDSRPMFALTFDYVGGKCYGKLYTMKHIADFDSSLLQSMASGDASNPIKFNASPFTALPVVEVPENTERLGMIDDILTLTDQLDKTMAGKINQNEYFNNAILVTKGVKEFTEEQKAQIARYHILQIENIDGQQTPDIEFLTKPDGDQLQENTLGHLTDYIYTTAQVINMSDPSFSDSTSSGEALKRKMQPMQMHATTKYNGLTQALQELLFIIFTSNGYSPQNADYLIQHTKIAFVPNIPESLIDESTVVKNLNGIVSTPTLLGILSNVDNVPAEIKAIKNEKDENAKRFAEAGNDKTVQSDDETGNQAQSEPPKPTDSTDGDDQWQLKNS